MKISEITEFEVKLIKLTRIDKFTLLKLKARLDGIKLKPMVSIYRVARFLRTSECQHTGQPCRRRIQIVDSRELVLYD